MCQYLDWELNIEPSTLKEFEAMVHKDFAGPGPYPTYVLQTISKLAATSTNPFPAIAPNTNTTFGPRQASPPKSTPLLRQYPPNPQTHTSHPTTPDTPAPSYSESTSPASSVSSQTPAGMIDDTIKIVSHSTYPGLSIVEQVALDFAVMKQKMFTFAAPAKW
jgi:hypothetical protein